MDKRKRGIVLIQVYEETREALKKLAAEADLTIPRFVAEVVDGLTGEHQDTAHERENDASVRKGDFQRTGRGEPKATGEFRELDIYSEKDQAHWMTWTAEKKLKYIEWWEKDHPGRFWEGDAAFFPTSLRC